MSDMTWKQFKEFVESRGVKDDDEIFYIDTYPEPGNKIRAEKDRDGWWRIWS